MNDCAPKELMMSRTVTSHATFPLVGGLAAVVARMAGVLDARMSFRLWLLAGGGVSRRCSSILVPCPF